MSYCAVGLPGQVHPLVALSGLGQQYESRGVDDHLPRFLDLNRRRFLGYFHHQWYRPLNALNPSDPYPDREAEIPGIAAPLQAPHDEIG